MLIALILLIVSLAGMTVMFIRKYLMIKNGYIEVTAEFSNPFGPELRKLKHASRKGVKRYAYVSLFAVMRMYIRGANFTKRKSMELAHRIERLLLKNHAGVPAENGERREASKYLKMITEYQRKIRHMKQKIKEEENLQ